MGHGTRTLRVAERVREELSTLLVKSVRDPGLAGVTVTAVRMTPDLQLARAWYTVADGADRRDAARGLRLYRGNDRRMRVAQNDAAAAEHDVEQALAFGSPQPGSVGAVDHEIGRFHEGGKAGRPPAECVNGAAGQKPARAFQQRARRLGRLRFCHGSLRIRPSPNLPRALR